MEKSEEANGNDQKLKARSYLLENKTEKDNSSVPVQRRLARGGICWMQEQMELIIYTGSLY